MPVAMVPEQEDDDFTFPTSPQPQLLAVARHHRGRVSHLPCSSPSSSPPVWLLPSSIRRSFSAADCAATPCHARVVLRHAGACSPALSDYAAGFCDGDEEERMDSLWEDLNDEESGEDLFLGSLDVSRRRSVGGMGLAERRTRPAKEREAAVLGASRSSRRRAPGLVVMMRALKKLFVAHKGKSKVHKVDEQSTAASASASSCSNSCQK